MKKITPTEMAQLQGGSTCTAVLTGSILLGSFIGPLGALGGAMAGTAFCLALAE